VTPTPTETPVPQGGGCTESAQCASGLTCADEVCCDTPCDQPDEACDLPGRPGTCLSTVTAQAPAIAPGVLPIAVGVLTAVGAFALYLRRRMS
jgi:hypothetical protein